MEKKASQKVLVNFIQDRSGSMGSVWDETVNGFKSFVKDLKENGVKDGVEYLLSLTTFDTVVDTPLKAASIADVSLDALDKFGPRGSTALYDAIGITIDQTEKDSHGADKIICVIVTDGQENSSREWKKDTLQKVIESKLDAGNWTFTYLGTQPETWDDATAIGMAAGATARYTGAMASAAYGATSSAVRSMSASGDRQSRSLFTSRHANPGAMRRAGMAVRPPTPAPPAVKPPVLAKKPSGGRWR